MLNKNPSGVRTILWNRAIRDCADDHQDTGVAYESRPSDVECVDMIWYGQATHDAVPLCSADIYWYLRFLRRDGKTTLIAHGPTTHVTPVAYQQGDEFLGIRFKPGTYFPHLPSRALVDGAMLLTDSVQRQFSLWGAVWETPTYQNADIFVSRLVKAGVLNHDDVIDAALNHEEQERTLRSVQQRFVRATGLTHQVIQQVERARYAATLLAQGTPIMDVVFQAGYYDHPHLTRSLKRFLNQTPVQIADHSD